MTAVALELSGDRKVSPEIRRDKAKDRVRDLNTFGLPAGITCPGATEFCRGCYAKNLERYPTVSNLIGRNYAALLELGNNVSAIAGALGAMVDRWADSSAGPLRFRIHWDGDFYSAAYARAWARVARDRPAVQFWTYTRSFEFVRHLVGVPNLALYLSVDSYNVSKARKLLEKFPELLVAWCAETQSDATDLANAAGRKVVACPENVGRLPLVVALSGKRTDPVDIGDNAQGACIACGICVYGRRDVGFATRKR